jgi:hypothetical protein
MASTMSSAQVRSLLQELARRLDLAGISAGVRVVGGAALAVLDVDRRATSDIDAVVVPMGVASGAIQEMAVEHDLPADWLNDAALAYIPLVGSEDWIEIYRSGQVSISIGSTPMLLAMKLFANRGIRDSDDIEFLLAACEVTCVQDAQEIYERYHAQDVLGDSAVARVEHWLSRRAATM